MNSALKKNLNVPNALTTLRLLMVPLFIVWYLRASYIAALIVFVLACLTDILDGKIARKYNLVTDFGKLTDPLADKLMQVSMLFCLVSSGNLMLWVPIVYIVKELMMVIGGAVLLKKKVVVKANWTGKLATVLLSAAVLLVYPWHDIAWLRTAGNVLVYVSVAATLFAFASYIKIYVIDGLIKGKA